MKTKGKLIAPGKDYLPVVFEHSAITELSAMFDERVLNKLGRYLEWADNICYAIRGDDEFTFGYFPIDTANKALRYMKDYAEFVNLNVFVHYLNSIYHDNN